MISFLEGIVEQKTPDTVLLNVGGVGYEVNISSVTSDKLPPKGSSIRMHVIETVGLYGGITTLYGFLTLEEKSIFLAFKDGLKNTGAKKALDYLDKAMKSLPDFHRAVISKDKGLLTSIFGFRSMTAEKIVASLHNSLSSMTISGSEKWPAAGGDSAVSEAIQALVALGYRESNARSAVEKAASGAEKTPKTEQLIKLALKYL